MCQSTQMSCCIQCQQCLQMFALHFTNKSCSTNYQEVALQLLLLNPTESMLSMHIKYTVAFPAWDINNSAASLFELGSIKYTTTYNMFVQPSVAHGSRQIYWITVRMPLSCHMLLINSHSANFYHIFHKRIDSVMYQLLLTTCPVALLLPF